jgi:hypothetical protein
MAALCLPSYHAFCKLAPENHRASKDSSCVAKAEVIDYFMFARDSAGIRTGIVRSKTTLTVHSRGLGRFGPCEAKFLSRGGLHLRRSLFNKICDSSWLRYVDGVTSLDLNDRSTHALGHSTLGVRWNHLVLGGDQVPARFGPPRRFADRAANGPHAPRNLGVSHKRGCLRGVKHGQLVITSTGKDLK